MGKVVRERAFVGLKRPGEVMGVLEAVRAGGVVEGMRACR
jgi:hypothetical protein